MSGAEKQVPNPGRPPSLCLLPYVSTTSSRPQLESCETETHCISDLGADDTTSYALEPNEIVQSHGTKQDN
jgi:hypothetical protein